MPKALCAPDKFRGSLTASEAARAIAEGASRAGWQPLILPLADGGEGVLDALGGPNLRTAVTGPVGEPIEALWRLSDGLAIIEMAQASGLMIAGGAEKNDPVRASTRGTGELIATALKHGARSIVVGVGGSATTDGGLGAVETLRDCTPFRIPVRVACDVETRFLDAARVYGPQKGATPDQVRELSERLRSLATHYQQEFGVDVTGLEGGGAAGGLAGGLAALGAELVPGFELVAESVGLDTALESADLVITGEGRIDATSFAGKVVGGVIKHAAVRNVPVMVFAGDVDAEAISPVPMVSLVERFGAGRAFADASLCLTEVVCAALDQFLAE